MDTYTAQTTEHRDYKTKRMGHFATVTYYGERKADNVHAEAWALTADEAIAKAIRDVDRLRGAGEEVAA